MELITCVNVEVLRWARLSSGKLSQKYFEKNYDKILKWENGEEHPTYSQLEELSSIYRKPIAVFFFPQPPEVEGISAKFRTMTSDEYNDLSYKIIRLINEAKVMQINLHELNNGRNPANIILSNQFKGLNYSDIIEKTRKVIGITIEKQFNSNNEKQMFDLWRNALYNSGINVFKEAFENNDISGFSLYDHEFPLIYINNSMSFTRQIFTLFHELYHLCNGTSGIDRVKDVHNQSGSDQLQSIERMCNQFAGDILIPTDSLESLISGKRISLNSINTLAKKYKVSREALMVKLILLKRLTWDFYNDNIDVIYEDFFRKKQGSKGGNYYNSLVAYLGTGYLKTAFSAYQNNKIDAYQLAQYTKTKVNNINTLEMAWGWKQ